MKWIDIEDSEIEVECKDITEAEENLARACSILKKLQRIVPKSLSEYCIDDFLNEIEYPSHGE